MKAREQGASHARGERAALYLRVSTDEQTTDNQLPELERLAKMRKLKVVRSYVEQASAAKARPLFQTMLREAHRGDFTHVLIWALDRFGRSMVGNLNAVLELDRRGVRVVSVREPWLDTSGPVRDLLVAIFSWVAEQERAQLVARTNAGIERARRKGVRLGRPPATIDMQTARNLIDGGMSLRKAARRFGVGVATLHRALRVGGQTVALAPGCSRCGYFTGVRKVGRRWLCQICAGKTVGRELQKRGRSS